MHIPISTSRFGELPVGWTADGAAGAATAGLTASVTHQIDIRKHIQKYWYCHCDTRNKNEIDRNKKN